MRRIAVVDDSETARMFVQRCLEAIGFSEAEFIEATNGQEALDKTKENPVDLIVTDLTMPVMDGETLLRQVKSDPALKEIPVLVITSAGNKAREQEMIGLGALAVIAKPFAPAELYQILQPFME